MNELALFNSLFEDGFGFPELRKTHFGMPKVDVKQNGDTYVLDMDLPGLTEKDVDLSLKDNVLTISASHNDSKDEKDDNGKYLRRERRTSSYQRSFNVNGLKPEDIEAKYENGVLTINLPKKELKKEEEAKKIEIK